jgi:hypothetical protein
MPLCQLVGLKAPITVRDLHSEVRRDWKQLIGRKLAHSMAVKTGLGECPKKRGSPKIRTRTETIQYTLTVAPKNHHSNDYYIACAVTSNTTVSKSLLSSTVEPHHAANGSPD